MERTLLVGGKGKEKERSDRYGPGGGEEGGGAAENLIQVLNTRLISDSFSLMSLFFFGEKKRHGICVGIECPKTKFPNEMRNVANAIFLVLCMIHQCAGLQIAITGSSQGIGLDAAKRFIAQGHTVYHACRSADRAAVAVQAAGT